MDPIKTKEEIRATPLPLPKGFEFCSVDIQNDKERAEVYKLLTQNYVEDDDNIFRFDYSEKFLLWALTPPGYHKDWHVGVRQVSNKRLRGFITGIPADMRVRGRSIHMAEINFLCVHKKLRDKRLAPVLIKEVTRRINRRDVWQAAYVTLFFFLSVFVNAHSLTQPHSLTHSTTTTQIHRRCGSAETSGTGSILASIFESEKTDRGSIQLLETTYDLGTYDQVVPCCETNTDQASSDA